MSWIDPKTGENHVIFPDTLFHKEILEFEAGGCVHPSTRIVWYTARNGAKHLRMECLSCFELVGTQALPHDQAPPNTPIADIISRDRIREENKEKCNDIYRRLIARQSKNSAEWWERYNEYLLSDQWKSIRAKVLARANNTCEGCGDRPAAQVHHLTYDHVFDEFLFELVAVCDRCHTRIHEDEDHK